MGRPLSVVFLIDALGWEVVRRFEFCKNILPEKNELGTVLGYSSAAIPSLLSGRLPNEHGAWAMYRLANKQTPFRYLRFLPKLPQALEWRTRRVVRRLCDRRGDLTGYYDLYDIPLRVLGHFDLAQREDPYQPGGLSQETIFDRLVADGVRYRMWYYKTAETDNMKDLLGAIGGESDLLFLYTAELDALLHGSGIFDKAVAKKLETYEKFLTAVFERGRDEGRDVSVYVISDHGMTDVNATVDIWGELERRRYRLGKDFLAFFDSTMARLWCDGRVGEVVAEILDRTGTGRELGKTELESYGCLFPDKRYGGSIFLMNPGVMIVPSFMGRTKIAAMHGYDPEDKYSKGCFLTNDRSGSPPASILDFKSYLIPRVTGKES